MLNNSHHIRAWIGLCVQRRGQFGLSQCIGNGTREFRCREVIFAEVIAASAVNRLLRQCFFVLAGDHDCRCSVVLCGHVDHVKGFHTGPVRQTVIDQDQIEPVLVNEVLKCAERDGICDFTGHIKAGAQTGQPVPVKAFIVQYQHLQKRWRRHSLRPCGGMCESHAMLLCEPDE